MNTRFQTILTLLILSTTSVQAQQPASFDEVNRVADLIRLGDARYAAFDTESAISSFTEAHSIAPEDQDVLVRLARTWNDRAGDLHATGNEQGARAASRKAITYAEQLVAEFPTDARSWFYLAASTGTLALFSDGREKLELGRRIEEYCRRSMDLDSTFALPHVALGMYYREVAGLGRLRRFLANRLLGGLPERPERRALIHMQIAERLAPDLPVVVFQRARTLELFGHHEEAIESYRRFVNMNPMNSRDVRNLRETLARFDGIELDEAAPANLLSADPPRSDRSTSSQ